MSEGADSMRFSVLFQPAEDCVFDPAPTFCRKCGECGRRFDADGFLLTDGMSKAKSSVIELLYRIELGECAGVSRLRSKPRDKAKVDDEAAEGVC